jgi:hypothetical protein
VASHLPHEQKMWVQIPTDWYFFGENTMLLCTNW